MTTIAIIDKREFSSYAQSPWGKHTTTLDAVREKLSFVDDVYTLGYENADIILSKESSLHDMISAIQQSINDECWIIYADAQAPLFDSQLLQDMLKTSQKYRVQYHFAEGYPKGWSFPIIDSRILPLLLPLTVNSAVRYQDASSNFFFEIMRPKLNDFDVETSLSPKDFRLLRIDLRRNNKSNNAICHTFHNNQIITMQDLLVHAEELTQLSMALPAYYNFQISGNCPQKCLYCPYPRLNSFNNGKMLDISTFQSLLEKIVAFSGEAVIGLSLLGEPSLHPDLSKIIQLVLSHPSLTLHIETSGIGWQEESIHTLSMLDSKRLSLIVSLDGLNSHEYLQIRGNQFQEVQQFIDKLIQIPHLKDSLWIQRIRINELEDGLQQFYLTMKERHPQLIIQKYHDYAKTLEQNLQIDLSPIHRHPCWALKREVSIYPDGIVHLCRVDIHAEHVLGNVYHDSLEDIWHRIQEIFLQHANHTYPTICQNCDEYYIYTF
ncbi:spiro-SPASM protein [Entomospira entomophila]|uniref:Spiro-SPASM protein n=1 Tax=Entomospira entomophila TaxID=2719988 RepID=A0A968KSZ4_9SPIO|nr:spiro-SPASM protein [Entomospira entomophilus]NIZ40892.1 spiro-SPASM protein [Entomospira entomophilus]WDI35105.1 spiro-SPASM protein [Entomospira entomophilus]